MPVKRSRIVVVEIDAVNRTTGAVETFYVSDWRYITKATDTPAKKTCLPLIEEAPAYDAYAHGPGRTMGQSVSGVSDLKLSNKDGRLDSWKTGYRFTGMAIRVYTLANSTVAYSTKTLWMAGVQRQPIFTRDSVQVRMFDRDRRLDRPLQTRVYLGTGGREGTAEMAGRPIPRTIGMVYGIRGELVDPSYLIFQVNDGPFQQVVEAYDGGYSPAYSTAGSDAADFSALRALVLTSAEVATCYASGYIRLGSAPTYGVTFDVKGDKSGGYGETLTHVLYKTLVTYGPLSAGDLYTGFTATLDGICTDSLGIHLEGSETSAMMAVDAFLQSVAAYRVWDRSTGKIRFGRLATPTTALVSGVIDEWAQKTLEWRTPSDDNEGVPPYGVRLLYRKQYTNLDGSFAPQTSAAERQRQGADFTQVFYPTGSSTLADYPDSQVLEFESLLVSAAAASAVASYVGGLRATLPDMLEVQVPASRFTGLEVGSVRLLRCARYGYTNGLPVTVTGFREDLNSDSLTLQLWRPSGG